MRVPFHNELDEIFRSDRSVWLKIAGCSLASVFVVLAGTFRVVDQGQLKIEMTPKVIVILGGGSAILGGLIGLALSLKDTVSHRNSRKDEVNPILRVYFGGGVRCLVVWFVSVLLLAMVVTVVGFSMGLF